MDPWTSWNLDLRARERTQCCTWTHTETAARIYMHRPYIHVCVCARAGVYTRARSREVRAVQRASGRAEHTHARAGGG